MGYFRAGFDVVGVDIKHQPRYPFEFHQGDALEFCREHGHEFDVIHASPPCQRYSRLAHAPGRDMSSYAASISETRAVLMRSSRLWVIENVCEAPLVSGVMLCGLMFGLRVFRHRWFESSTLLFRPGHLPHTERIKKPGAEKRLGYYTSDVGSMVTVAGHLFSRAAGSAAMEVDWMTRDELAEAIPPAYTEFIGHQLILALRSTEAA